MLKFNFVRFGSICLSAVMCTASESERVSTDEKSDKDPCSDEPCGEKGECSDLGNGFAYACQCERGWVDDENYQQPNCKKYDETTCHDSLCEHGGKCPVNDPDNPNCECPKGYIGRWCEHASPSQSSKWVGSRLRSKMGAKSALFIIACTVLAIILVCFIVCCVQCIKRRNAAKKSKSAKDFKSSDRTEKRYETPASTLEEERSLLSPQMSPRPILRNGPFPTPPSAASVQPVRTMQMGAPALSFQSN
ncbi:uncharacterized protein LOC142352265 isoform X2 [Convolutriloba macropyga]|uniref:uncharacterized protein LOC142352265 isoform X2 n=1 Tax=Convolutriloba macropyga TaxID=536237 RepID=UPI003F523209